MLTKLKISSKELAKLNYERYHYPCPLVQKRVHSIFVKALTGFSNCIADVHRNSSSEWIEIYLSKGFDGLVQINYGANKSLLENEAISIKFLKTIF